MNVQVTDQVLVLFLLMATGFLSYKLKITTKEAAAYFSSFVMKIPLPCMMFSSFLRPYTRELLGEALFTLGIALVIYAFAFLLCLAYPYVLGIKGPERGVHRYVVLIPNSGLIGFPVIAAVMGPLFIFHASMFCVPGSIMAFSAGLWLVAKEGKKAPVISWKFFASPLLIATLIGFSLFLLEIRLPGPLEQSIGMMGTATSPLAMAVIGISIAQANIKQILGRWRVYVTVAMRLLVIPALVGAVCYIAGLRGPFLMLPVILCSMPAGSTTSIFSSVYDVAIEEAGSLVALSVILCSVTIPLVVIVVHFLGG